MLVKMKNEAFQLLSDEERCNACFEPLIRAYKKRMSSDNQPMDKEQFYKELTHGQQALFAWQVYYNHANKSLIEYYWWSAYFMAQPKIWSEIKAGLTYFGDDTIPRLLEETEIVLKQYNHPLSLEGFTVTREDLHRNKELLASISVLHTLFEKATPLTIKKISAYIENNRDAFIHIDHSF